MGKSQVYIEILLLLILPQPGQNATKESHNKYDFQF